MDAGAGGAHESALAQVISARPHHPVALVPIVKQGGLIRLPRSGPRQRVDVVLLSVATEASSTASSLVTSVQWTARLCEASATG
jgi:hypothetical protein